MDASQPDRLVFKPDIDEYAGVDVLEPRGFAALVALLRARPSSDLALVGVLACSAYIGAHAKQPACILAALGAPVLLWLLTALREERHRAAEARPHQPRDHPDGQGADP